MHPLVTACKQHRVWLTPVSTRALRAVRHARGMVDLVACSSCGVGEPLHDGQVFIDDALWLQQLYIAPATSVPIWSGMPSRLLNRIIDALARLMMSDSASSWARERMTWTTDCAPVQHGDWSAQGFTVNDRRSSSSQLILPTCLRRRQWVLGLVGHLLRHPARSHASGMAMPSNLVRKLLCTSVDDWPIAAIDWISPQAGQLVRSQADLRARHGVSPAYFRANSALFRSLP